MSTTILLKPQPDGSYQWLRLSDAGQVPAAGNIEQLLEYYRAALLEAPVALVLIAPAHQLSLRMVSFEDAERKLLAQTVPYALEDDLSCDVSELHFALATPVADAQTGNQVAVAVIDRRAMQTLLAPFIEAQLELRMMIPEPLMLPWQPNSWTLLFGDEVVDEGADTGAAKGMNKGVVVRYDQQQGLGFDDANMALGLQLLLDESETPPASVQGYAAAERQREISAQLPELLPEVEWRGQDSWSAYAEGWQQLTAAGTINLLQGEFGRSLPWQKWWKYWRVAALVAGLAIALHLVYGMVNLQSLKQQNLALRGQIEQVYRQAVPKGKVVEPERQLRRRVAALKGKTSEGFISVYATVAQVMSASQDISLEAMNYSDSQSEMRLTLLAPSFNDIEVMRTKIESNNLEATLTGSSNEGGKTRARLKVSAGS